MARFELKRRSGMIASSEIWNAEFKVRSLHLNTLKSVKFCFVHCFSFAQSLSLLNFMG